MIGNFVTTRNTLLARLDEPAPGRIQMLTGPRQVGKTTILREIADKWEARAIYLSGDSPLAAVSSWWLEEWERVRLAAKTEKVVLLFDEVHLLTNWSRLLKAAIDEVYWVNLPLQMVITGSAALPLTSGMRESMAGRFERLTLRHWSARDLVDVFGFAPDLAAETHVRFGSFPGAVTWLNSFARWRAYVLQSVIEPALGRDVLMLEDVRRPALLRQVFAVCLGHASEIVSLNKIAGSLMESGALETIAHYLHVLGAAYLVAALPKFSTVEIRRRSSPPKLVPLSNAFMAASFDGDPPTPSSDPRAWGRWLENACIAEAVNAGHRVSYWREESREVDMVVSGECGKWAVEVKSSEFATMDLASLYEFCGRHPEYRPLIIGEERNRNAAERHRVRFLRWQDYLLDGFPKD
jgi:predicted AAA+ superfamily ATPase